MNNEEYDVIDLEEIIEILKKHIKWLIIIPLIFAVIAAVVSIWLIKPVYEASTTIIVRQDKGMDEEIDIGDVNLGKGLVYTYAEMARSNTVIENTRKRLELDKFDKSMITVSPVRDTQILKIAITNTNPVLAADIANTLVEEFTKEILRITRSNNVAVVDYAVVPMVPVKPDKMMNTVIAAVLGEILTVMLIFLREYMDKTVKTERDIEKYIGVPVIGSIPNFNQRSGNVYRKVYGKEGSGVTHSRGLQKNCN